MVYRYVCNGFLRQIRLRSYQSALPVPRILVLCNHLQNVVATTYIFRLQLSTFIFYNKHALSEDSAAEGRSTISGKGRRFDSCTSPLQLNIAIGKDAIWENEIFSKTSHHTLDTRGYRKDICICICHKIDIANIYLGILFHYLLVLAAVLLFGY